MADIVKTYSQSLWDSFFSTKGKIKVPVEFHERMRKINSLMANDVTALISSILEFQVQACTVPITFDTNNDKFTQAFAEWTKDINSNLNIDIPRGLRSLTEQYQRERLTSSFIVLKGRWGKVNGFWMPTRMWFLDGTSIYVQNDKGSINTAEYYFGRVKKDKSNQITSKENEFTLIRKPFNKWTDEYPTPYLVKVGALYHALLKQQILERQANFVGTPFPMGWAIKAGCEEAMKRAMMPTPAQLEELKTKHKNLANKGKTYPYNTGFLGAYPFDVNFENLIPDYLKILDEKILKSSDKNLLSALGLIEFKGFSSNREEAILNPKVLVERCEDAVLDYLELLDDVVYLIKKKNGIDHRNTAKLDVRIHAGIIKAFIDDKMRALIRNWYDRGLVCKQDAVENTTPLNFETQVRKRDQERKDRLHERCYPPPIQNLEQYQNDPSDPSDDNIPDDKKPGSPESKNYKNAKTVDGYIVCENCESEIDYDNEIEAGMGYIKCPICGENINQEGKLLSRLEAMEYLEAPYTTTNYPAQLKNLPQGARNLWIRTFNRVLKDTNDKDEARKAAWHVVKLRYKKVNNKWVRLKKAELTEAQKVELASYEELDIKEKKIKLLNKLIGEQDDNL